MEQLRIMSRIIIIDYLDSTTREWVGWFI